MASKVLTVRVELELEVAVRARANELKVTPSELLRTVIRQGLGVCDLRESGYREGKLLGYAEHRSKQEEAFAATAPTLAHLEGAKR